MRTPGWLSSRRCRSVLLASTALLSLAPTARAEETPATVVVPPTAANAEPAPPKVKEEVRLPGASLSPADRATAVLNGVEGPAIGFLRSVVAAETPSNQRPRGASHYIVRFGTTDMVAARRQIEAAGAAPLEYVPDAAWIVRMSGETSVKVEALTGVDWVGRYRSDYKVAPGLRRFLAGDRPVVVATSPPALPSHGVAIVALESENAATNAPSTAIDLQVRLFPGASEHPVTEAVAAAHGSLLSVAVVGERKELRVALPRNQLALLYDLEGVQLVDRYVPLTVDNDAAMGVMHTEVLTNHLHLTGAGQVVGHADSGLDVGTMEGLHPDLRGRVKKAFARGRQDSWSDENGHGTHTAGSIIGSGVESPQKMYRGMAVEAELVHQSVADAAGRLSGIPADLGKLLQEAYDEGARIHSDSWGDNVTRFPELGGAYRDGEDVDRWLWNGGQPRDMLVVIAAGNHGGLGAGSVGSPGTAKNGLTVGATENSRPTFGADGDDTASLASFSSLGPTDSGRIKPDLVAPGTWVVSTRTRGDVHLLDDDVEAGTGEWNKAVTAGSTWAIVDDGCASGHGCWTDSAGGNYADGQDSWLESDWLRGRDAETLVFRGRWRHVEPASAGVYVMFDGGNGWTGYQLRERNENWPGWDYVVLPVPSAARGTGKLRVGFRLTSDAAGNAEGISVDDVLITSFGSWAFLSTAQLAAPADALDTAYTLSGGTSMSTPLVAGAAALIRQHLAKQSVSAPSAELVKAILINGADNLSAASRPNPASGWGRVNLERSVPPDGGPRRVLLLDRRTIGANQAITVPFEVTASGEELRATLVWPDPPGEALVHDLDMTLIDPAGNRHFMPGAAAGSHDSSNNIEGVDLAAPAAGSWQLEVRSSLLQVPQQPFAVVISGALSGS